MNDDKKKPLGGKDKVGLHWKGMFHFVCLFQKSQIFILAVLKNNEQVKCLYVNLYVKQMSF